MAGSPALQTAEAAPAVPQSGDSPDPAIEAATPTPALDNQFTPPAQQQDKELHFTLSAIRVDQPETHFSQKDLDAITAQAVGHEITVKDLDKVLSELAAYGRSHGYPAAYAFVPEQRTKNGVLEMRIALGRYGKVIVEDGAGKKAQHRAEGLVAGLRPGDIIKERSLETALVNVNDMYGVNSTATLVPGETEGTSDLIVKLEPGRKKTATLYTDNYGSKSSGRYRYGFQAGFMDLGETGGRLTIGGLLSNDHLHDYNIGWDMMTGHSGTVIGIRQSRTDYELGSIFAPLDARGIANTTSLYGTTPLWRTAKSALVVNYGYAYRNITDEMRAVGIYAKKHSNTVHVGLEGTERHYPHTALHGSLTAYVGNLSADSFWAEAMGNAGDSLGHFTKGVLDAALLQDLGHSVDLLMKLQGQLASRNLDSSEKLYLGGIHGVRAYPSGEASGDEGVLANVEVRYHTPVKGLMARLYFDAGHVRLAKNGMGGSESLKGWGIGVTYTHPAHWFARLDYARRIGLPALASEDARSHQRFWFLAGKTF